MTDLHGDDARHVVSHDVSQELGHRAVADFDPKLSAKARRFHGAFEPIAASVYFAAEVHEEFERLGFGPGVTDDDPKTTMTLPDPAAYYCSRAGCMGKVAPEVVVAAFGVFSPRLIIPNVERGWATASLGDILAARLQGEERALPRILGDAQGVARATELMRRAADAGTLGGRFLYAGLSSLPEAASPWGRFWRQTDRVREYRGDSHIAVWCSAGLDPVEAGLLTEIYYTMPSKRYHYGRGWTTDELDAGLARLRARGIVVGDPPAFTDAGRVLREAIEIDTDRQCRPMIDALGEDYEELLSLIEPWAAAIVASPGGYPTDVEQLSAGWGRVDA
jgi:hypothetical protein